MVTDRHFLDEGSQNEKADAFVKPIWRSLSSFARFLPRSFLYFPFPTQFSSKYCSLPFFSLILHLLILGRLNFALAKTEDQ